MLLRVSAVTSLSELDPAIGGPATEQARQSACRVQSIFLETSRSATAGHVFHSWLEPRRAEATVSASELEARLKVAPVEQFQDNHSVIERSAYQAEVWSTRNSALYRRDR